MPGPTPEAAGPARRLPPIITYSKPIFKGILADLPPPHAPWQDLLMRRYSKSHQWVEWGVGVNAVIGVTDYAQQQLGDVVYVDLPRPGVELLQGAIAAQVESVKTASDVVTPVSGRVVAVNTGINDAPEQVNADAEGEGWLFTLALRDPEELEELLDRQAYQEFVDGGG